MDDARIGQILERLILLEQTNAALHQQNRALRRKNHRTHWLVVGFLLCAGVVALVGAKSAGRPKVVEAEYFVLRDAAGKERGAFRVLPTGMVELYCLDEDGRQRVQLGVTPEYVMLDLIGKGLRERVNLSVPSDGSSPSLMMYKDGNVPVVVSPTKKTNPTEPPIPLPPPPPAPPPSPNPGQVDTKR